MRIIQTIEPEDRIDRTGMELSGLSKMQAELFERRFDSPLAVYGQPFMRDGWKQLVDELRRLERKCQIDALRERYRGARAMASKMPPGASPWDCMVCMWEVEQHTGLPIVDGVARRLLRESAYKILMRFTGRNVG